MTEKHERLNLPRLQEAFNQGYLQRKQSGSHPVTLRATARLEENAHLQGRIGRFHFECDEPPERGGEDTAPSPLEYFLMGAVF